MLLALVFLSLVSLSSGKNPCKDITIGDCPILDDSVVGKHPYGRDVCHLLCTKDDACLFWRHDRTSEGTKDECIFFSTDYHQDCETVAGPANAHIDQCQNNVNMTSCDAVLLEDCDYSGERLNALEFEPGHTSSIDECQLVAQ